MVFFTFFSPLGRDSGDFEVIKTNMAPGGSKTKPTLFQGLRILDR